jgi:hypothetical protein
VFKGSHKVAEAILVIHSHKYEFVGIPEIFNKYESKIIRSDVKFPMNIYVTEKRAACYKEIHEAMIAKGLN